MKIGNADTEKEVVIVAEIGNNHEGSYTLAEELIAAAAEAGAHAVKFQTFRTENYITHLQIERFERLKRFELSFEEFELLAACAKSAGLAFLSTPLDLESARFLEGIVDAYKIASGDINFKPLIEAVAKTGKPIILSTGACTMDLVQDAYDLVCQTWHEAGVDQKMALLHCVSAYPVPPDQANLSVISALARTFDCQVGYSDHTQGIDAPVLAVALGARIIEKHFTIDRNYSDFRDHQLSADPSMLKEIVERIIEAQGMIGDGVKRLLPCEEPGVMAIHRSVAAKKDLPKGHVLEAADITWIRPGGGLRPGEETLILGRRLSQQLKKGEAVTLDHVSD